MAISPVTGDIDWEPCKDPYCRGAILSLITDEKGFVIHPNHIRGRYVFSRVHKDKHST